VYLNFVYLSDPTRETLVSGPSDESESEIYGYPSYGDLSADVHDGGEGDDDDVDVGASRFSRAR